MLIPSKKRFWINTLFCLSFGILLLWIPLFWRDEVILDKAKFATEYYKSFVDLGKILFGFWLANIFLQKTQISEFVQHIYQQWKVQTALLLEGIQTLEMIPKNHDIDIKSLVSKIRACDIRLRYLSELISSYPSKDKIGEFGTITFEYEEYLHNHVKRILESLEQGETIALRPFNNNMIQSIDVLKTKLQTS
jgi:hypothetical protein